MRLRQLKLQNFKNYTSLSLDISSDLICIVGLNGSGKTNLLDTIHYLTFTKSAFANSDGMNIKKEESFFMIKGLWEENNKEQEIICYQERNQKKILKRNKVEYEKLSEHIGQLLAVMSTPYDTEIIRDSGEVRRKWIDGCISQYDPVYLENLLQFQRQLKQRNALIKQYEGRLPAQVLTLLGMYDEAVIDLSKKISHKRQAFLDELKPYFIANLEVLVEGHDHCSIEFKSKVLTSDFDDLFISSREKDLINQRTTMGCHRDDFLFKLEEDPIKRFGSQGQQKSFLIALKLAQYDHLAHKTNRLPVLLLDDVFDKLDDERINKLLHLLTDTSKTKKGMAARGQVFITDARMERTASLIKNLPQTQLVEIKEGNLVQHE